MKKTTPRTYKKFTTAKLEEILANEGVTDAGTAYDHALDEVAKELNRRYTRQSEHETAVALARVRQFDFEVYSYPPPIGFTVPPIISDRRDIENELTF